MMFQSIWVVTFLSVIVFGVDIGLLFGVVYSLATVIARTQLPRCEVLVNVSGTDVYKAKGDFKNVGLAVCDNLYHVVK